MEKINLTTRLQNASRARGLHTRNHDKNEWDNFLLQDGIKNLKRYLIGFCGEEGYKTEKQVIETFEKLHMIKDYKDGQGLLERINGEELIYANGDYSLKIEKQIADNGIPLFYVSKSLVELKDPYQP
tara:strand:- start:88 stop:468 length:381 start_codon:yes stop_codon:yes gene_type:complete